MNTSTYCQSAAPQRQTRLTSFGRHSLFLAALLILLLMSTGRPAQAAPSGLTYLGQLLIGGTPANGSYDFQFKLFDAATGGSQVGATVSLTSVPVTGGVYYAFLYFGTGVITGQNLWIQVAYRVHPSSGNPPYTTLTPRNNATNSATADYAQLSGSTAALQGKPISTTAPTTGQVLQWNGMLWTPATIAGGAAYTAGTGLTLSGSQFSVTAGGITSSLLATNAVTNAKLADGSVTNSKLASASVTGSTLALPLTASVSSSSDLFSLTNTGSGAAIAGTSTSGSGVYGAGSSYGVYGVAANSYGVYGSGHTGVAGFGSDTGLYGNGVYGMHGEGTYGVYGNGNSTGVYGSNNLSGDYGFLGGTDPHYGLSVGVFGSDGASSGNGVLGLSTNGSGVAGVSSNGNGVYGYGPIGVYGQVDPAFELGVYAGYFDGDVYVSGTLSKAGGSFKIDDPLDPAHKSLSHSFVESPDMKNIYDGTALLDASGAATITMPKWFQALNQDYRYQLTAIGAPGPNLYIAHEIAGNSFGIAGGQPGAKVSWQVTGTRHDAWANAHRIPVEEDKPDAEQGLYLNPEAFGLPASLSVNKLHATRPVSRSYPKPPASTPQ